MPRQGFLSIFQDKRIAAKIIVDRAVNLHKQRGIT
jgi:hypothetical protein